MRKKEFLKRIKGKTNDMWVDRMNDPQNHFYEKTRVTQMFIGKAAFFFCNLNYFCVIYKGVGLC